MILALRVGAFLVNLAYPAAMALLLGLGWVGAAVLPAVLLVLSWWACGLAPRGSQASPEVQDAASRAARRMGAPPPRWVRAVSGWTAAAVRGRGGYGLLVGEEIEAGHREAVMAHEIAHHLAGDLLWEPFTDGPARLTVAAARKVPPLVCALFPFLLVGAPLARATELRADRLATERIPTYPLILKEVMSKVEGQDSLLYPSLAARVRHSARHSEQIQSQSA